MLRISASLTLEVKLCHSKPHCVFFFSYDGPGNFRTAMPLYEKLALDSKLEQEGFLFRDSRKKH